MSTAIATNKKAFRDYFVLETFEAGIELKGSEVKSLRSGNASLADSFAKIEGGQVLLYNAHISPYAQASYLNVESVRPRRLLLHKKQIKKLDAQISQGALALIPLKMYWNSRGIAKMELAVGKGKKVFDKREDIKNRETDRKIRHVLKHRRK
jgi:SsrA-binding protein